MFVLVTTAIFEIVSTEDLPRLKNYGFIFGCDFVSMTLACGLSCNCQNIFLRFLGKYTGIR